jgi:hypothetical protein
MVMAEPYGPNTRQVRRFLQRLAALSTDECVAAARIYRQKAGDRAMIAADRALGIAIETSGRTGQRDTLAEPLMQLLSSHASRLPGADATHLPGAGTGDGETSDAVEWEDIAEAALAAALAVLARDLISTDEFVMLYSPYEDQIPVAELV